MSESAKPAFPTQQKQLFHIELLGQEWVLEDSADLEEIWAQMNERDLADERIPYWVELWPASIALAQFLFQQKDSIAHQTVLELGCGLGFTAMIGSYLGANVVACDYALDALRAAARNASLNQVQVQLAAMDWRASALADHSFGYIWAADILYERRAMSPVLDFLVRALKPDGRAWIAEPGRGVFGHFIRLAHSHGWKMEEMAEYAIPPIKPETPATNVLIWELSRPGV